jgi:hypothetical protein
VQSAHILFSGRRCISLSSLTILSSFVLDVIADRGAGAVERVELVAALRRRNPKRSQRR